MNIWKLGFKQCRRDLMGGEFRLIALAILLAVSSVTALAFHAKHIEYHLNSKTAELLGGDKVIEQIEPIRADLVESIQALGLKTASVVQTVGMLFHQEKLQLSAIRAVSDTYPLKGEILVQQSIGGEKVRVKTPPEPGTIWLEPRLASLLSVNIGDSVLLANETLQFTQYLDLLPDNTTSLFTIAPMALVHEKDILKTTLLLPGSRAKFQLMVAGTEKQLKTFEQMIKPQLKSMEILKESKDVRESVSAAIDKGENYLTLTHIINTILSGIAIAIVARRYAKRHQQHVAIMRCLGADKNLVLGIFFISLLMVGLLSSTLSILLGYLLEQSLPALMGSPISTAGSIFHWQPIVLGYALTFILLLGFALPAIYQLKDVPPILVLRRLSIPKPEAYSVIYLLSGMAIIALMIWQGSDLTLTLSFGIGLLAAVIVLYSLSAWVVQWFKVWALYSPFISLKLGILNVSRHKNENAIQLLALTLLISVALTLFFIKNDLLTHWESQLPKERDNFFAINISPKYLSSFEQYLNMKQISPSKFYPIVRGRITHVNQELLESSMSAKVRRSRGVFRPLNFTWSTVLQQGSEVIEGRWFSENDKGANVVSVEQSIANRLNIRLQDTLQFVIGGKPFEAVVTSIRQVKWDTFLPNFYFIFPEQLLDQYPYVYMTSFYLPEEKVSQLNDLSVEFSSVSLINADNIIQQIRGVIQLVVTVVQYLWLYSLMIGALILYAIVLALLDVRLKDSAILRAIGGKRHVIFNMIVTEYSILGLLSGFLAAILANMVSFVLQVGLFQMKPAFNLEFLIYGPLIGITVVTLSGILGTQRVYRVSPITLLRDY